MREKDEITGLFRSRLSGTEMTVRDGFWEQLQEDAASPAAGRKRAAVLSPKYYRKALFLLVPGNIQKQFDQNHAGICQLLFK